MLRRPPTQLSLTRDDIATYSLWRQQQTQQAQISRERQLAAQAQRDATRSRPSNRRAHPPGKPLQRPTTAPQHHVTGLENEDEDEDEDEDLDADGFAGPGRAKSEDMDVDNGDEAAMETDEEDDTLARVRERARAAAETRVRPAPGSQGQTDSVPEVAASGTGRDDSASARRARVMGSASRGASNAHGGRGAIGLHGRRGGDR